MKIVALSLMWLLVLASGAHAQAIEGDWQGTLKAGQVELRIVVHVTRDEKGALKGTMDSPDQGANRIPITGISVANSVLKFEVGAVMGSYEGKINGGATAITGLWSQLGMALPLDLARATAVQAKARVPKPSEIDGDWSGALDIPMGTLKVILHITTYDDGMTAKLDVPDQKAMGLPATSISRDGQAVKVELKQLGASYNGTLDKELATLTGTWSQLGNSLPLIFKRTGGK